MHFAASGLGAVSLRYFNVAGASGRYGERHDPETHLILIPLVPEAAAGSRPSGQVFGTGPVRQVLDAAMAVTGRPIPAVDSPRRAGDPAVLAASSARARRYLGWEPEKPELKTMVADAWAFARRGAS